MLGTQGRRGFNIFFFSFPTAEPVNTLGLALNMREVLRPGAHGFPYQCVYAKLSVLMWYKSSRKSLPTHPSLPSSCGSSRPSMLPFKKETVVGVTGWQYHKSVLPAPRIRVSTAEHAQARHHGPHAEDGCRLSLSCCTTLLLLHWHFPKQCCGDH